MVVEVMIARTAVTANGWWKLLHGICHAGNDKYRSALPRPVKQALGFGQHGGFALLVSWPFDFDQERLTVLAHDEIREPGPDLVRVRD